MSGIWEIMWTVGMDVKRRIKGEVKWWNASLLINLQSHNSSFYSLFGHMKREREQWWIHFDDSDSKHCKITNFPRWMIISFNDKALAEYQQMRFNDNIKKWNFDGKMFCFDDSLKASDGSHSHPHLDARKNYSPATEFYDFSIKTRSKNVSPFYYRLMVT